VILFGVDLQVTATGPTTVAPGAAWSAFNFRVVDGTGATWTGAVSNLAWQITNAASAVVQSGSLAFTAGVASVTPAPINTAGSYTLTGSITSPNTDSASIGLTVSALTFINQPGPFVALKSVRVNNPYTDSVAFAAPNTTTAYAIMSGSLPAGLTLNTTNGTISGTPTAVGSYEFSLYAALPASQAQPIRCALAVFSTNETEFVSGQSFVAAGPYAAGVTGPVTETYTFTSSYDNIAYPQASTFNCRLQYYYPNFATAPSPAPVLVHHRGRGFSMFDYDVFGAHVASYGIIFISVEDYQSFADSTGWYGSTPGSGQSANGTYDTWTSAYRGQASGSAFQEGVMQWVIAKNAQSGHALQNRVDVENIFMSGHSRGGGSTQSSHVRSQPYMFNGTQRQNINIKGVIIHYAVDMRYWPECETGSGSLIYPIATMMPRLPSLIFAAENDGDVSYPFADEFLDRATGPSTFVTLYGGTHAFLSDGGTYDAGAAYQCTRQQQMDRAFNFVIAFMKRWSNLDLTLEGLLYGNEKAGSQEVGVCAWRNMAERVVIEDNQDSNTAVNNLGGTNTITGGNWTSNTNIYPNLGGNMASMNLRHGIFTLPASTTATWTANIPAASQNFSRCKRVIFHCGTVDITSEALKGYDFVTFRVRLTDTNNDAATVTIFDRTAPSSTYLPDYNGSSTGRPFDRFVDASILLSAFTTANPQLTLTQLSKVEFIFETAAGVTRQLYFDDLRFE